MYTDDEVMKLRGADLRVLEALSEKPRRFTMLKELTGISSKTLWDALQSLQEKGLVEEDEFKIYRITEQGRKFLANNRAIVTLAHLKLMVGKLHRESLTRPITEEDVEKLEKLVRKLRNEVTHGKEMKK